MSQTRPPLKTIQRTFDVLEVLWNTNGAGPTEVAKQMDLPKSTVYGYLRALKSAGYVVQEGNKYKISYKFLSTGGRIRQRNRIFQISKPELRKLSLETGEIANLNIEERSKAIILHQEEGEQALNLGTYPGMETPLHSHAAGKVLLAYQSEEKRERLLDRRLEKVTDETISDPEELQIELEQIREQGYAIDWDQQVPGMGVVSSPILIEEQLFGAIGVVCPKGRLEDESYHNELIRKIRETADMISVNYQYGT